MSTDSFLEEFVSKTKDLQGFDQYRNWENLVGVYLDKHETQDNAVSINGIFSIQETGQGAGTKAIKGLMALAQKHGVTLISYIFTVSPNIPKERIEKWYAECGFTKNGFDNLDFGTGKPVHVEKMEYHPEEALKAKSA